MCFLQINVTIFVLSHIELIEKTYQTLHFFSVSIGNKILTGFINLRYTFYNLVQAISVLTVTTL